LLAVVVVAAAVTVVVCGAAAQMTKYQPHSKYQQKNDESFFTSLC